MYFWVTYYKSCKVPDFVVTIKERRGKGKVWFNNLGDELFKANLSIQGDYWKVSTFVSLERTGVKLRNLRQSNFGNGDLRITVSQQQLSHPLPQELVYSHITYKMRYSITKFTFSVDNLRAVKLGGRSWDSFCWQKVMFVTTSCEWYSVSFLKRTSAETFHKLTPNARNIISSVIAKKSEGINKFHRVLN